MYRLCCYKNRTISPINKSSHKFSTASSSLPDAESPVAALSSFSSASRRAVAFSHASFHRIANGTPNLPAKQMSRFQTRCIELDVMIPSQTPYKPIFGLPRARYVASGMPTTQYANTRIGVVTAWYPAPTMTPETATCTPSVTMRTLSIGTNSSSRETMF